MKCIVTMLPDCLNVLFRSLFFYSRIAVENLFCMFCFILPVFFFLIQELLVRICSVFLNLSLHMPLASVIMFECSLCFFCFFIRESLLRICSVFVNLSLRLRLASVIIFECFFFRSPYF